MSLGLIEEGSLLPVSSGLESRGKIFLYWFLCVCVKLLDIRLKNFFCGGLRFCMYLDHLETFLGLFSVLGGLLGLGFLFVCARFDSSVALYHRKLNTMYIGVVGVSLGSRPVHCYRTVNISIFLRE